MAIEGTGISAQYIQWTSSNAFNKTQRSMAVWHSLDTNTIDSIPFRFSASGTTRQLLRFSNGGATTVVYDARFSTTGGLWVSTSGILVTGGLHLIVVTYDGSSVSNDPIIEFDNVNVSLTETSTPVGTLSTGENEIQLLAHPSAFSSIDGKLPVVFYFDHVLSRAEKDEIWYSKSAFPRLNGLVFAPQLWQRGEVGEGGTLTSSHTIADAVSGALGTPSGSPLHKQDTYLRME